MFSVTLEDSASCYLQMEKCSIANAFKQRNALFINYMIHGDVSAKSFNEHIGFSCTLALTFFFFFFFYHQKSSLAMTSCRKCTL